MAFSKIYNMLNSKHIQTVNVNVPSQNYLYFLEGLLIPKELLPDANIFV